MIPIHQRIHGNGENGAPFGDCLKCCVASILELQYEEVPHFAAGEWKGLAVSSGWMEDLNDWLETMGWNLRASGNYYWKHKDRRSEECALETRPRNWHSTYWIGAVASNHLGCSHAVVMQGDYVVHDPGLEKPRSAYEFLGELLLLPANPAKARI